MSAKMTLTRFERGRIERSLAKQPAPDLTDPDNPEWTEEDFACAVGPEDISAVELAAFPKTLRRLHRGPQTAPTKRQVSLRLDLKVVEHFRATGRGWQSRINAALLDAIDHKRV